MTREIDVILSKRKKYMKRKRDNMIKHEKKDHVLYNKNPYHGGPYKYWEMILTKNEWFGDVKYDGEKMDNYQKINKN